MKILLVWPVVQFSVWDVAKGINDALVRAGHEVRPFDYSKRFSWHARAAGEIPVDDPPQRKAEMLEWISRQASETIAIEATYGNVDAVLIVSGLSINPISLKLMQMLLPNIPIGIVLTESPYEDAPQTEFVSHHPKSIVFTNERTSADQYGWHYLPHAVDPAIHRPVPPVPEDECDVLFIGSGWPERIRLFESIDWTGLHVRFLGVYPDIALDSPIAPFVEQMTMVPNMHIASFYCSAKIVLNFHRSFDGAVPPYSLNPRVREVAACGAFQLTDFRPELADIFGDTVATFDNGDDLSAKIRYYASDEGKDDRLRLASGARERVLVATETFDDRAAAIVAALSGR